MSGQLSFLIQSGDVAEQLFILINIIAGCAWLLLLLAPYKRITKRLVHGHFFTRLLAVMYVGLLFVAVQRIVIEDITLLSLGEILSDPWLLLLGWTHIVCFDLIAGIWMSQDAVRRGIRHRYIMGSLLLTFLLGPLGFLAYFMTRFLSQQIRTRKGIDKAN